MDVSVDRSPGHFFCLIKLSIFPDFFKFDFKFAGRLTVWTLTVVRVPAGIQVLLLSLHSGFQSLLTSSTTHTSMCGVLQLQNGLKTPDGSECDSNL